MNSPEQESKDDVSTMSNHELAVEYVRLFEEVNDANGSLAGKSLKEPGAREKMIADFEKNAGSSGDEGSLPGREHLEHMVRQARLDEKSRQEK